MKSVFHAGERAVQERAGVAEMASRVGNSIHTLLPPVAQEFLQHQRMVIIASRDAEEQIWASLLTGKPGFVHPIDEQTVFIEAEPLPGDPLRYILETNHQAGTDADTGMLAIELATRKRMRVNGKSEYFPGKGFALYVQQAYSNCPKYIQVRKVVPEVTPTTAPVVQQGKQLSVAQQLWVTEADTFFIASFHPEGGADASHRGGNPGFVHVLNANTLRFPDYSGNNMFNTLGNLAANPRAGLLFVDFEHGGTLQLTGEAEILWDAEAAAQFSGAQRVVEYKITSVIQTDHAVPWRWQLEQVSPFNPR